MIEDLLNDTQRRMQKALEALAHELTKIRTGRASSNLLDHVQVDYYGNMTPLNQVASVSVGDARTIMVSPWEKTLLPSIEKAILHSDLGLNPVSVGDVVRVPMPALTEERRKELIKVVRGEVEQTRISVRNVRRDVNNQLKELTKAKDISEDDERRGGDRVQKLTDKFIADIEDVLSRKEKDLMEV